MLRWLAGRRPLLLALALELLLPPLPCTTRGRLRRFWRVR